MLRLVSESSLQLRSAYTQRYPYKLWHAYAYAIESDSM